MVKFLFFLLAESTFAASFQIQNLGQVGAFSAESPQAGQIRYAYRVVPFDRWSGIEKKWLDLYPGFQPEKPDRIVVYVAKVVFVIPKAPAAVKLDRLLDLKNIQHLDETIDQKIISPADILTYKLPKYASHNPPSPRRWCDDPQNTVCLQSNFRLPSPYQYALALYETGRGSPYKTLEGQSEIRIQSFNDVDVAGSDDLRQLTGIETAPAGLLVQSTFWFTHAIEYIKIFGVVQPAPSSLTSSIVTGFYVFAIEKKTWEMKPLGIPVQDVILGKMTNFDDGILAGLPKLTQHLSFSLAELLSQ